jgi:glycosyltransferase involved in cell wall biosynthesis
MPIVSVIIPTYNRATLLRQAIQSVLEQTFSDYEIIVADDGSTDNTRAVVQALASDKIKYLCLEHKGRSHARNCAVKMAQGHYLAFLDSDDLFLPRKLDMQVFCLDNEPEVAMVYTSALNINERGGLESWHQRATGNGFLYRQVVCYALVLFGSLLVRAQVFSEVGGFDENLSRFEDVDFCRRVAKKYPIQGLYQPLAKFRYHSENAMKSQDPAEILRNMNYYVDKWLAEDQDQDRRFLNETISGFYYGYGIEVKRVPQFQRAARPFFVSALKYKPLYFSAYFQAVDCLLGGRLRVPIQKLRDLWSGQR